MCNPESLVLGAPQLLGLPWALPAVRAQALRRKRPVRNTLDSIFPPGGSTDLMPHVLLALGPSPSPACKLSHDPLRSPPQGQTPHTGARVPPGAAGRVPSLSLVSGSVQGPPFPAPHPYGGPASGSVFVPGKLVKRPNDSVACHLLVLREAFDLPEIQIP